MRRQAMSAPARRPAGAAADKPRAARPRPGGGHRLWIGPDPARFQWPAAATRRVPRPGLR